MKGSKMIENIDSLEWHVKYARKEQIKRLTEYLEEDKANTIGTFLNKDGEWQTDSLIRWSMLYIPKIKTELEEAHKPFWKKLLKK
jgi:5-formyltetrahydrofolate cyclo-ligase